MNIKMIMDFNLMATLGSNDLFELSFLEFFVYLFIFIKDKLFA